MRTCLALKGISMPTILMTPADLEDILTSSRMHENVLNAIRTKIAALTEGEAIFKKKRFNTKMVYTVDVNIMGAHRLIFDLVEVPKGQVFVLRKIAFHHAYDKALRWVPFKESTVAKLKKEGYQVQAKDISYQVEEKPPFIQYKEDWLELTEVQSSVLKNRTFPQLVIGPPGAGKTLLSAAFFQEQALFHQENSQGVLKLLFISHHERLTNEQKGDWNTWAKKNLSLDKAPVFAVFLTFDEFYRWYLEHREQEEEFERLEPITHDECMDKIEALRPKGVGLTSEEIFNECLHSSHLLGDDFAKGVSFEDSRYKKAGTNQISVEKEHQQMVYELYQKLQRSLNSKGKVFTEFLLIPNSPPGYEYDFIWVDEVQNSPLNSLLNAQKMAKGNRVIFSGDSFQRAEKKVSSLPILEPCLHEMGIPLVQRTLVRTHRLNPSVAALCEQLILLDTTIRGGLPDDTAYSSFSTFLTNESDESLSYVEIHDERFHRLGNNAKAAALVLNDTKEEIAEAKKLIGDGNALYVRSAQGIEFTKVFIYLSKDALKRLIPLSEKMKEKGIEPMTELSESKHASSKKGRSKEKSSEVISDLFVALSRSTGEVWVYLDPSIDKQLKHNLKSFLSWFRAKIHGKSEVIEQISSDEEWLETIHKFYINRNRDLAESNLQSRFKLTKEQAKVYLDYYEENRNIKGTKEFLTNIQLLKEQKSNESTVTKKESTKQRDQKIGVLSHEKEKQSNKTSKETQLTQNQAALVLTDTQNENFKPLSQQWRNYVKKVLNSINNEENLRALLRSPKLKQVMFFHEMENGFCLFSNICASEEKYNSFINNLVKLSNEIESNEHSLVQNFMELVSSMRERESSGKSYELKLALLCFSIDYEKRNKKSEDCIEKLEKVLSAYLAKNMVTGKAPECGLCRLYRISEENHRYITNLIIAQWVHLEKYLSTQTLIKSPSLPDGLISYGFMQDVITYQRFDFILRHIESDKILNALSESLDGLFTNPNFKKIEDKYLTVLISLCSSPDGIKIIDQGWDLLSKKITNKVLCCPIENDPSKTTALSILVNSDKGIALVKRRWDFFNDVIDQDSFNEILMAVEKNNFFISSLIEDGIPFVVKSWERIRLSLSEKILMTFFIGSYLSDDSLFFPTAYLLKTDEGVCFINSHWSDFFKDVFCSAFFNELPDNRYRSKNNDLILYLFETSGGINVVRAQWDFFKHILDREEIGRNVLKETEPFRKSIFQCLCTQQEGIMLISEHWGFFSQMMDYDLLNDTFTSSDHSSHETAITMLCRREISVRLINDNWRFFSSKIDVNVFNKQLLKADGTPGPTLAEILERSVNGAKLVANVKTLSSSDNRHSFYHSSQGETTTQTREVKKEGNVMLVQKDTKDDELTRSLGNRK